MHGPPVPGAGRPGAGSAASPAAGPGDAGAALWAEIGPWAKRWAGANAMEGLLADLPNLAHHPSVISTRAAARDVIAWARTMGYM